MRILLCSALAILASACGDDGGTTSTPDAAPTVDAQAAACTHDAFAPTTELVERDDELGVLAYTARAGLAPNIQVMTFDLYFPLGATDAVHDFVFTGVNLADCHTCLVMRRECSGATCATGKIFLAQEGTAHITAIGASGSQLTGSLENLKLAEVTIGMGLQTTLVPGGETWCLDNFAFDQTITTP